MTVQLFIPCYVDQFAPHVAQSLCDLLDKLNIAWNYPEDQTCCGQFAFNTGDWPAARRLMRHFFKVFSNSNPIVCPGSSCVLTIRHYYPQLAESTGDAAHIRRLQPLVFEFSEWLHSLLPLPYPMTFPGRVFLHQSCTARQLGVLPQLKNLLGLIPNLQLAELSSSYSCCGFGGLFSLKRPDLSRAIGSNYLGAIATTDATALVSSDIGCLLHLQGLLHHTDLDLSMYHIVELIHRSIYHR